MQTDNLVPTWHITNHEQPPIQQRATGEHVSSHPQHQHASPPSSSYSYGPSSPHLARQTDLRRCPRKDYFDRPQPRSDEQDKPEGSAVFPARSNDSTPKFRLPPFGFSPFCFARCSNNWLSRATRRQVNVRRRMQRTVEMLCRPGERIKMERCSLSRAADGVSRASSLGVVNVGSGAALQCGGSGPS
jgi:hypothetical protein